MKRRVDLDDIRLLMHVVEQGSYTAAARTTGVSKSTISLRIAALEQAMGTGLLRRTSRSFSLTDAGMKLMPHARAIEELTRQVEQSVMDQGGDLQGTLRVSCSQAINQFALSPVLPRFLSSHKQVSIRVEATNRLVDMIGEGYDMTVRGHVGLLKDSSLIQRIVARTPWVLAASPDWIARHGSPPTPNELPLGEALHFSTTTTCEGWTLRNGDDERLVRVTPRLISDEMVALRASATAGGGIACLPGYLLRTALASGQLVRVLPDWIGQTSTISVITPPKAQSSRLARAFSQFLVAELPPLMQV